MQAWELVLVAAALAMDATAVSIGKGLSVQRATIRQALTVALYFGVFQGVMPLVGFVLADQFGNFVTAYDHWIAFVLLTFIGLQMVREALSDDESQDSRFDVRAMIPLAVATSIDAMAVGVSFAFLKVDILFSVLIIGIVTAVFSGCGLLLGARLGVRSKSQAEILGGVVLIVIGLKILLEHLGIFA